MASVKALWFLKSKLYTKLRLFNMTAQMVAVHSENTVIDIYSKFRLIAHTA